MIVTILAEPRSGSTNLANWFLLKNEFTVLFEPITNLKLKWYKNNIPPSEWQYTTNHLLVKEIGHAYFDFSELINISDKIIVLYRENGQEQLESFLNAIKTNNWHTNYVYKKEENDLLKEKSIYFNILKTEFKENYINKEFFTISYEELYYNNGFQKILDYLNIDELENKNFPYGSKYRVNLNKPKSLI
jgi:uncharacterized protein YrzB (UPF0473 family)